MSDGSPIQSHHQGTFIAAAFVVGILGLGMGAFALREARTAGVGAVALEVRDRAQEEKAAKAAEERIKALEARVAALEA